MTSGKKHSNPPQKFICEYCNKPFKRVVYPSSKGHFRFCSPLCRNKARTGKLILYAVKLKQTKSCKYCAKTFVDTTPRQKRLYCSIKCTNADRTALITKHCRWCSKKFQVPPSRVEYQYCSIKCYWKSIRKERITTYCSWCGKQYRQLASRGTIYCSEKCSQEAHCGENHPRWKGGGIKYYGPNWGKQSRKARKRDNYTCQSCGLHKRYPRLTVHHIVSFRTFNSDWQAANQLDNLITICAPCHNRIESGVIDCPQLNLS